MKHKSRILFLGTGPLPVGGAGASLAAPGVANRLWHFVQPAAAAGFDCSVVLIDAHLEPGTPAGMEPIEVDGKSVSMFRVSLEEAKKGGESYGLSKLLGYCDFDLIVGAGTLQASATACAIAGNLPVWVDYFGDPLAEIQAKADWLGDAMPTDEVLMVWQMMMATQRRADAFSTVSRRQADALLGQLLIQGRMDFGYGEAASDHPVAAGSSRIAFMPCCIESFAGFPQLDPAERAQLLQSRNIPADARIALWSGGFNAWVDPRLLAEVVVRLLRRDPTVHFVATGGELPGYLGRVYEIFSAEIARSSVASRAHLLGWLPHDESLRWMAAADAALLVDRPCAETRLGARNRLLYHAAAGCPVVATTGTEVVEEMAEASALIAMDLPPDLFVSAIHDLLRDEGERAKYIANARDYCERHYSFAATTGAFLRFAANPTRAAQPPALGAPQANAASWIAHYLDVEARHSEWEALKQFNEGGKLARIKNFLSRKPKDS